MASRVIEDLIEAGYKLDTSPMRRGWLPPDWQRGDLFLWPTEAAHAHLVASRELADDLLIAAAEGDGYVRPLTVPDVLPL
jgi:hypothetical protein